ncbi:MAG: hypothetical protein K8R60_16030 [Burkholderiales bacterium]|nr:hypothetical protein [Burkholderiales bacterium]
MNTPSFAVEAARAALVALLAGLFAVFVPAAMAQSQTVQVSPLAPATSFAEASQLFRAGRHAAAYGRFARLANEGNREAAGIALVMHRHGVALFGSNWDATTEELEQWSALAQWADRAEIASRQHPAASAMTIGSGPGQTAYLAPEAFRGDRRRKR